MLNSNLLSIFALLHLLNQKHMVEDTNLFYSPNIFHPLTFPSPNSTMVSQIHFFSLFYKTLLKISKPLLFIHVIMYKSSSHHLDPSPPYVIKQNITETLDD